MGLILKASASGFFYGAAFGLGVDTALSQRRSRVIETGWGQCRAPGLRKTVRGHHLSEFMWLQLHKGRAKVTIKLENHRGAIRASVQPEADKPEEQHYNKE
jgi:hypothetical protein